MANPTKREAALLAQARRNIRLHGELAPTLIVSGEKSGVVGFAGFGPGEQGRQMLREAGRRVAHYKPYRVSFVVDTWIKDKPGDMSDYKTGDLSRDPSASEGILVSSETRDGLRRVVYQRYDVDEAGKYVFEPPEVWEDPDVGSQAIISEFWRGVGHGATE